MSTYFWLDNGSTTIAFDDEVSELEISGNSRDYKAVEITGTDGGTITGYGTYSPKTITISRKETKGSAGTAWNTARNTFMSWLTTPATTDLYFYLLSGEGTLTVGGKVYPQKIGGDKYKYYGISETREFTLLLPQGYLENINASTGSSAIADDSEHTVSITNSGLLDVPAVLSFTPTGAETMFQCQTADNFGFRLEGNFSSGVKVSYDTADGSLTIGGVAQNALQYLTAGSVFKLLPGTNSVYVQCSGAGSFDYSFKTRYI